MQTGGLRTKGITKTSSESQPLITVVTVVYNAESTLEQTILSVINQNYDNVEYILVDGASTDGTLDIIKKYEDKIDYWISEPDKGIYDAMNKGIDLASGIWINFMNAGDEFYTVNVVEDCVSCMKLNYCYYGDYYDDRLKNIIVEKNRKNIWLSNICHQTIFYYTDIIKKNKFNLKYKILADYALNLFLFTQIDFVYIDIIVAKYEGNGVSIQVRDEQFYKDYNFMIVKYYGVRNFFLFLLLRLIRKSKTIFFTFCSAFSKDN